MRDSKAVQKIISKGFAVQIALLAVVCLCFVGSLSVNVVARTVAIVIGVAAFAAIVRIEIVVHAKVRMQKKAEKDEVLAWEQRRRDAQSDIDRIILIDELHRYGLSEALAKNPSRAWSTLRGAQAACTRKAELETARNSLRSGFGPTTVNDLQKLVAAGEITEQDAAQRLHRLAREQHARGYFPTLRAATVAIVAR